MAAAAPSQDPIYEELRTVRDDVAEVLGVLTFIASDPEAVKRRLDELRDFFGAGARRADVYVALDPDKNIFEVAQTLGMKRENVSREVQRLREHQLIVKRHAGGRGEVWVRNPTLERVLRLSRRLRDWYPASASALGGEPTCVEVESAAKA